MGRREHGELRDKMNAKARALGLASSKFTDPSGLDAGSVSTPTDLVKLGHAAMADPTFEQIVAMPQVTLPLAGLLYNVDSDVGHGGMVGIKTGTDSSAGGCFLFEARTKVNGTSVTLDGVVLGQRTAHPTAAALAAAAALVKAAFASFGPVPVLRPGQEVGRIVTPWGSSVPVTVQAPPDVLGWSGMTVPVHFHVGKLPPAISVGSRIGVLSVATGGRTLDVVLRASRGLAGPSITWRLTR
jgi:D-alanyl-D-alanine carboxypeptidase (penicillin-binding protein 5/6)